ncbi:MAG TPA: HAMP domain-containing sensor histidine kinase [Chryseosolibacter sp.]
MIRQNLSPEELLTALASKVNQNDATAERLWVQTLEDEILRLGKRLREAENGKSQFLSNVRNEVNNPLSAIIGLAASITGLSSEEKIRQMSTLIEKQAAELDFQMRNIIMAAAIEAGELIKNPCRVDIERLVEGQIKRLRHRIDNSGVSIEATIETHFKFRSDANILEIICINILSNAIEFCGGNKKVIVDARRDANMLTISVRDFGSGIEPRLRADLFRRFQHGETGSRKRHAGHGLGLCLVNELVTQLEGHIEIQSSTGQGTMITIVIPELEAGPANNQLSFGNELLFTEEETF